MADRAEIEIDLKLAADTAGADQTVTALNKVEQAATDADKKVADLAKRASDNQAKLSNTPTAPNSSTPQSPSTPPPLPVQKPIDVKIQDVAQKIATPPPAPAKVFTPPSAATVVAPQQVAQEAPKVTAPSGLQTPVQAIVTPQTVKPRAPVETERFYHGTRSDFDQVDPKKFGSGVYGPGYYLTKHPEVSDSFAGQSTATPGGNVRPIDVPKNLNLATSADIPTTGSTRQIPDILMEKGFHGIRDRAGETLALFPNALPQITNALSGKPEGVPYTPKPTAGVTPAAEAHKQITNYYKPDPNTTFYHGTASDLSGGVDPEKLKDKNLFGRGFYLTDEHRVAGGVVAKGDTLRPDVANIPGILDAIKGATNLSATQDLYTPAGKVLSPGYAQQRGVDVEDITRRIGNLRERYEGYLKASKGDDSYRPGIPKSTARQYADDTLETLRGEEAKLAQSYNTGPNVVPFKAPTSLKFADVDKPLPEDEANAVVANVPPSVLQKGTGFADPVTRRATLSRELQGLSRNPRLPAPKDDPDYEPDWYRILAGRLEDSGVEPHEVLSKAGFGGVKYAGGRRIPIQDEQGNDLEHTALAVFPSAVKNLQPALLAKPSAPLAPQGPDPALLAALAKLSPEQNKALTLAGAPASSAAGIGIPQAVADLKAIRGQAPEAPKGEGLAPNGKTIEEAKKDFDALTINARQVNLESAAGIVTKTTPRTDLPPATGSGTGGGGKKPPVTEKVNPLPAPEGASGKQGRTPPPVSPAFAALRASQNQRSRTDLSSVSDPSSPAGQGDAAAAQVPIDTEDPAIQSRLYEARRKQEAAQARILAAYQRAQQKEVRDLAAREKQQASQEQPDETPANQRAQAGLQRQFDKQGTVEAVSPDQLTPDQQEAETRRRARASAANQRVAAGLNRRIEARGTTEEVDPSEDPRRQQQLYQLRAAQTRQFNSGVNQFARQNKIAPDEARRFARGGVPPKPPTTADDTGDEDVKKAGPTRIAGLGLSSAARLAAGLFGIQLGLSVVANLAVKFHDQLAAAVDEEHKFEAAARASAAALGAGSTGAGERAKALSQDPSTAGSAAEFLKANNSLQTLNREYGLNQLQIGQALEAAGHLAKIQGTDLPQTARAVQSALQGDTSALNEYGVSLVDAAGRVKGVGASYNELVGIVGRTAATQILLKNVQSEVSQEQKNAKGASDSLATAYERLNRAQTNIRQGLGEQLKTPVSAVINAVATGLEKQNSPDYHGFGDDIRAQQERKRAQEELHLQPVRGGFQQGNRAVTNDEATRLIDAQVAKNKDNTAAVNDAITAQNAAAYANEALGATIQKTTATLDLNSTSWLKNQLGINRSIEALGRLQDQQAKAQTIGQAATGPDLESRDTQTQGQTSAYSDIIDERQQRVAREKVKAFRQQLVSDLNVAQEIGPNSTAKAQAELDEFDRRAQARTRQGQAEQAKSLAQRGGAESQSAVQAIELQQQTRQLAAAQALADVRKETLDREGAIISLGRQEADLADKQRVAARENLDLINQQVQARQAARPANNAFDDISYEQKRLQQREIAIRADVRRGALDASALNEVPDIRRQERDLAFAAPRAEYEATEANRPGQLLDRQAQAEQDSRTLALNAVEAQRRVLEDQLTPLQEAQRLTDERTSAINRQLELANLAETAEKTAAQYAVIQAQLIVTAAEAASRNAERWAAGIKDGLDDLGRASDILSKLPVGGDSPATGEGGSPDRTAKDNQGVKPPAPPAAPVGPTPGPSFGSGANPGYNQNNEPIERPEAPRPNVNPNGQYIDPTGANTGERASSASERVGFQAQQLADLIATRDKPLASQAPDFAGYKSIGRSGPQWVDPAGSGGRGDKSVTINFTGDLTVRSDADIDAIGQRAAALALHAIADASREDVTPYAPNTGLTGAN